MALVARTVRGDDFQDEGRGRHWVVAAETREHGEVAVLLHDVAEENP